MRKRLLHALVVFIPALFLGTIVTVPARAQGITASIRGTVTDASGAVIPGVQLTATEVATNLSRTATSSATGSFEFLNLPIGTYRVAADKSGFKTFQASAITLTVNQIYVLGVRLQVGEVSQQVTVEAAPIQVETTSIQRGTTITGEDLARMPMLNRDWVTLQQLQPGVVADSSRFGGDTYATNGDQAQHNSFLVNGVDTNDIALNTSGISPSPDALAEFRMITSTIDPEYSRNSGAVLSAVIKSGTNNFHGSAFEYFRDTSLNTRDFFQPNPLIFHRNLFGGTVGGPVWKGHTFFFFSYQGFRARRPETVSDTGGGTPGTVTVLTSAQRNGFFGAGALAGSSPIPLFGDAASACPASGGTPCPAGTSYGQLFSTGQIPSQDLNPVSVKLLNQFVPLPNSGVNFTFTPVVTQSQDQELFRIDHTFNAHDSVWWYSLFERLPDQQSLPFIGATLPGFAEVDANHNQEHVFSWTHIISSSMVNELRFGSTRLNILSVSPVSPALPSSEGFRINPQDTAGAGLPNIGLTGFFDIGFSIDGPQPRIDQNYQITDDLSKFMGNHSFKLGWAGRRFNVSNPFHFENNGNFSFGGSGPFSTGNPAADFLLGFPDTYAQSSGNFIDAQAYENYVYFQDQWKMRPNFTLTYGLGYQIDNPMMDRFNDKQAIICWQPGRQSTVFATAPVNITYPGDKGCTASGYRTHYNQFGPRLGFAWSPRLGAISGNSGNFSIRGGFGMYYDREVEEITLQNLLSPPFALFDAGISDVGGVPSFVAPFTDVTCIGLNNAPIAPCTNFSGAAGSISNKYPFLPPKAGSAVDFSFFEPLNISVIDPNFRLPVAMNYNLTIERQLPSQIILDVAYVGSESRHDIAVLEQNPGINPKGCAADPTCVAFRAFQNLLFPDHFKFPGNVYGGIGQQSGISNSNYNSLQVSANKALSHGLSFLASYTWSHSLDDASSYEDSSGGVGTVRITNPFSNKFNYGNSAFDARQRLVLSYNYNIPNWGRGPLRLLGSRVTGGWEWSGVTTFQTGFPVSVFDSNFTSLTCDAFAYYGCWDNPNVSGHVSLTDPRNSSFSNNATSPGSPIVTANSAFDPNLFSHASFGTFGNTGRNFFRGPGLNNWDMQLTKVTKISESTNLQLRIEFYNLFNHEQFAEPIGNLNSGNFSESLGTSPVATPRLIQLAARFVF